MRQSAIRPTVRNDGLGSRRRVGRAGEPQGVRPRYAPTVTSIVSPEFRSWWVRADAEHTDLLREVSVASAALELARSSTQPAGHNSPPSLAANLAQVAYGYLVGVDVGVSECGP